MEFNGGLSMLIETLKSVAISQYYAMEKKLTTFAKFFTAIEDVAGAIDLDSMDHIFTNPKGRGQAVVAITSDGGFLGGLNMKVMSAAIEEAGKMPTTMIIVGARGKMYLRGDGFETVNFPGIQDDARFEQAMQLRDYIYKRTLAGEFGTVKVVYPRAASIGIQHIEMATFLPFRLSNVKKASPGATRQRILESSPGDIVEYLVHLWMGERLHDILGLSRLAEFSARYIHLEESSEKLKDEDKKVKLQYFRARHELADRAIRELVAGRSVREKK